MRRSVSVLAVVTFGLSATACGDDGPPRSTPPEPVEQVDPAVRAVVVATRPCGDASSREASGVLVAPGRVVTAAHVVSGSREVSVVSNGSSVEDGAMARTASVVVLDLEADVAVLDVRSAIESGPTEAVTLTRFVRDQQVRLVGGAASGSVDLVVSRPVRIDIDGRRLGERVERDGYELIGPSADGDSGAGVYDADGRLGALVFARSDVRDDTLFAVEASEIAEALESPAESYRCDESLSSLVRSGT